MGVSHPDASLSAAPRPLATKPARKPKAVAAQGGGAATPGSAKKAASKRKAQT